MRKALDFVNYNNVQCTLYSTYIHVNIQCIFERDSCSNTNNSVAWYKRKVKMNWVICTLLDHLYFSLMHYLVVGGCNFV